MKKKKLLKTGLAVALAVMTLGQPVSAANWVYNNTGWWWREDNGSYPANQWKSINGRWYWFDSNGYMATGWRNIDGTWYYLESSGAMAANKWIGNYYVEADGAMATNKWIGNYYVNDAGLWTKTRKSGQWISSGNRWWYRHSDGTYTRNGWETIAGTDYLFDASGWMLTGWQAVNGTWYYMNSAGAKVTDQWVGDYYVDDSGAWVETKGQHHWNKGVETVAATCTKAGVRTYTCKVCGDTYTESISEAHKYELTNTVKATCTQDGYKEYTCKMCKDTYREKQEKLDHDFKLEAHKDPTCQAEGYDLYKCSRCQKEKKDAIAVIDHKYELTNTVNPTCVADGYKEYTCTMCKNSYRENLSKLEHDYDMSVEVERVDSTCGTHGHVSYKCKNCDDIKSVELPLDATKHNYVETGKDLQYIYYTCSGCGDTKTEFNDATYTIDLGNGQTTTVVGHFDLQMRQEIYNLVVARREKRGSNPIALAPEKSTLQDVANIRAYEITNSYSHTRPNGKRAITSFYSYACTEGENLAKGQRSAEQVCDDWFASPGHLQNIVSNNFNTIGIGVFCQKVNGGYVYHFSQMFSPKRNF